MTIVRDMLTTYLKLMGHKDIGVTLNTYTTVFDKFKENEIDKVNQYYLNENLIKNNNTQYIDSEENNSKILILMKKDSN